MHGPLTPAGMGPEARDIQPTQRFSNRADFYAQARPDYPPALRDFLKTSLGLRPEHHIADVGSGTGILSALFLANGNTVLGIEPNAPMRGKAEESLRAFPLFRSVDGTAEATTLPDAGVDFAVAGQAFHWFDPVKARIEFRRILAPGGWVVLVWNERCPEGIGFDAAYDELIRQYSADGSNVDRHSALTESADETLGPFFGPGGFRSVRFDHHQEMDLSRLRARVASSSYMPLPDHPAFPALSAQLDAVFQTYSNRGRVRLSYQTRAYYGKIT
ncbi:MAG TPA: class I SAM-dependent methyltransferase [Tepidisphaeraceae bacterium]|nr:class I SAM-dependent methyltransferase [Tepidisphaeraceae bacterium]